MAITGNVFIDKNGNGLKDPGDQGLQGIIVTIIRTDTGALFGQCLTDGNGFYTIDDSGLMAVNYTISINISQDYIMTATPNPNTSGSITTGDVLNFGCLPRCTRTPESSWVWKVCFYDGQGVMVTFVDHFKHKSRKFFTCLYPNTTLKDYTILIDAASKGRTIHWFYDKKRVYVPWPISL